MRPVNNAYYHELAITVREGWYGKPPQKYKEAQETILLIEIGVMQAPGSDAELDEKTLIEIGTMQPPGSEADLNKALVDLGKQLYVEGHRL